VAIEVAGHQPISYDENSVLGGEMIVIANIVATVKEKRLRLVQYENYMGYVFVAPWIVGFLLFYLGPMIASLALSFTRYDVLNPAKFIGLGNYRTMSMTDDIFKVSLYNTFYITILGVPLNILIGLSIALLLNLKVKGMTVYRTIYYLPSIVPVVASSILWLWILNPHFGVLNLVLEKIGIPGPGWISSPVWSKPSIIMMRMWGAGSTMIIYLAGLKGIPESLYEAAEIDGATTWRKFIHITLPMLTPTLFFTTVMQTIQSLQVFTQAFVMTQGGPAQSTLFYVYNLYNNAFVYFKMGYASALAWILFLIILIITVAQLKLAPLWVHYEAEPRR
jgi:multiple sugar transport system permease protein